ncbi:MAG: FliH/SctL family protein [Candidatus Gastranaerophilales bacterium]|nr:FliH/SctL family protein [Candidatus Gastranaerophilales bacterium]
MSKYNLLKGYYTQVQADDKRVLRSNELIEQKIAELSARRVEEGGFTAGLKAETLEIGELPAEGEDGQSNVIKLSEDLEKMKAQATEEAEAILSDARTQADALIAEAKEQAELEKDAVLAKARDQGYRDGYEEGQRQAAAEADQLRAQMEQKEQDLEASYQQKYDELEPQFVDAITGIYEHIFHVELQSYREILVHLIGSTMRKIEGGRSFLIHVSKEDYPYVSMQKKQIAANASSPNCTVEIVEDMTVGENGCLIETEGGIFDCGLGTQLTELGQKLRLLSYE